MLYNDPWVFGTSVALLVGVVAYAAYLIRTH